MVAGLRTTVELRNESYVTGKVGHTSRSKSRRKNLSQMDYEAKLLGTLSSKSAVHLGT